MDNRYSKNSHKIHSTYPVGTIISIGKLCLNNPAGTKGVVYENYQIGGSCFGCSIIFPNGSYDGFSERCLEIFEVNPIGFSATLSDYQFENVGVLEKHFRTGRFSKCF